MDLMGFFRKPRIELEKRGKGSSVQPAVPAEPVPTKTCPLCSRQIPLPELGSNLGVCMCGHHFRMNARQRISLIADGSSFQEMDGDLESPDPLLFPGYPQKAEASRNASREKEGVLTGTAVVRGTPCALFAMEPCFMMGSMGTVVGEKLTRLFEYATENRLPVVGFTVSGGAGCRRVSYPSCQMAKVAALSSATVMQACFISPSSPIPPPAG